MGASARQASRVHRPPFLLGPGLVAEMLRFHDQVASLGRDPSTWLEEAALRLEDEAPTDRGAERLLLQTRFLREACRIFDARVEALDGVDERALHAALRRSARAWCPSHVIVSVADHHADPNGLWPVDLELLADAPGLRRLDIVATRRVGEDLFARLRHLWADAVEVRVPRQRPAATRLEVTSGDRRWI